MKVIFILALLFQISHQQTLDVNLENNLLKATNFVNLNMKKVSTTIKSCMAHSRAASMNLKAVKVSKSLTNSLDAMTNYFGSLQIADNFGSLTKCLKLSTCECIQFRIVISDFNIKKINFLTEQSSDLTFPEIISNLTWNYAENYKSLQAIWTREASVIKTLNQSQILTFSFLDFIRNLEFVKKYFMDVNSYLIPQFLLCRPGNSTFHPEGNVIDENLRESQNKLQELISIAVNKINNSLNTLSSVKRVQSSSNDRKAILSLLSSKLRKILTVDDYRMPNLTWPHIPDVAGAGGKSYSFMKVRTSSAKKDSYSFTLKDAQKNKTQTKKCLDDFKSANSVTSAKKVQATALDLEVINATDNVVNWLEEYSMQLNISIEKVEIMRKKYEATICGFRIEIATNVPTDPATLGFFSGLYRDNLPVYPGSMVHNAKPRPARVTPNPPRGCSAVGTSEACDKVTAEYFYLHPNLKWTTTLLRDVANVTGKVEIFAVEGKPTKHFVTRTNLTLYQQIGGLWVNDAGVIDTANGAFYFNGKTVLYTKNTFEILVCQ